MCHRDTASARRSAPPRPSRRPAARTKARPAAPRLLRHTALQSAHAASVQHNRTASRRPSARYTRVRFPDRFPSAPHKSPSSALQLFHASCRPWPAAQRCPDTRSAPALTYLRTSAPFPACPRPTERLRPPRASASRQALPRRLF